MKKILIIQPHQFGYLVDSYMWAKYLKDSCSVTVLCYNQKYPVMKEDGVSVRYVSLEGCGILRILKFLLSALLLVLRSDVTIVEYFRKCEFIRVLCPFKKIILDIRTLSVNCDEGIRSLQDSELRHACSYFKHVTVISKGVRDKLGIQDARILPLGAESVSLESKKYQELHLLYIGTLTNRNIEQTILGFKIFCENNQDTRLKYSIVGDGNGNELEKLKKLVVDLNLEHHVILHGRKPHSEIAHFFEECNVGVAFIPIVPYYEYQPSTKIFEYIASGLFTIATRTDANKEIISEKNGILIDDKPESFADALEEIRVMGDKINTDTIQKTLSSYTWECIVRENLKQFIDNCSND